MAQKEKCTLYFIEGCPFPEECMARLAPGNTKSQTWTERSPELVRALLVRHCVDSDLHYKSVEEACHSACIDIIKCMFVTIM